MPLIYFAQLRVYETVGNRMRAPPGVNTFLSSHCQNTEFLRKKKMLVILKASRKDKITPVRERGMGSTTPE
jgi:hypothetical protein